MTVAVTSRSVTYNPTGTTPGPFAVDFPFFDLTVILAGIVVDPSEYTITQSSPGEVGSVTFLSNPTGQLILKSSTEAKQDVDFISANDVDPEAVERALDRGMMALQDLQRDLGSFGTDWEQYEGAVVRVGDGGAFEPFNDGVAGYVWISADGTAEITPPNDDTPETVASVLQAVKALTLQIGDGILTMSPTPRAGRIRLGQTEQTFNKATYPELSSWLAGLSTPYPWGSTSTTFTLPPAAGYHLRFAATDATIDPDGPRTAGSTQSDLFKSHFHSGETDPDGQHDHVVTVPSGGSAGSGINSVAASSTTVRTDLDDPHSHLFVTEETGGDETRGKNVAFHLDIVASSQAAGATLGYAGFSYTYDDTSTSASGTAAGKFRLNNATLASVSAIHINRTDNWGSPIGPAIDALQINQTLRLSQIGAQSNFIYVQISGSLSTTGSVTTIPVLHIASNGTLPTTEACSFEPSGPSGDITPALEALADAASASASAAASSASTASTAATNAASSASTASTAATNASNSATAASGSASTASSAATAASGSATTASGHASTASTAASAASASASAASTSETNASASATAAASAAAALKGTSTSSNAVGTGAKTFTTQSGKQWTAGQTLVITDDAAPSTNYMIGTVTSYSSTSLVMDITTTGGSGTKTAWTINVSGMRGLQGPAGSLDVGALSTVTAASNDLVVIGDASNSNATAVVTPATLFTAGKSDASETATGVVELATTIEATAGTDTTRAVTPAGLKAHVDAALTAIRNGVSSAYDTLAELATPVTALLGVTGIVKSNGAGTLSAAVAGTDYQAPIGSISGIAKGNGANALTAASAGSDYMHPGTTSTVTKGMKVTPHDIGTVSSGTTTLDMANGNYQKLTNNGAFTLAAPSDTGAIDLEITNGASAGSITFSGFTVGSSTGSALTTTNTNKFIVSIRNINGATYSIYAKQ